jgi:hypothetical protein
MDCGSEWGYNATGELLVNAPFVSKGSEIEFVKVFSLGFVV